MATKKKMLQAAAGNATGGAGLNVEEVFSTYLYTGDASTQTITNDIDLDGEGGLVWIKDRSVARNHCLTDTERGAYSSLATNLTSQKRGANTVTNFSSSGFTVAHDTSDAVFANTTNASGETYASWTFRKAPKFFDVVTYTGDGTSNRQIAHNIGGTVGFILIKRYNSTGNWLAWHRQVDPGYGILDLTLAFEAGANGFLNDVTDTYFETSWLNTSGATYVAYLFAHNDDDGEFGPDGAADIIKCGSFTDSSSGWNVDLGFEPQFLLAKRADGTGNWEIVDTMRGFTADRSYTRLYPNLTNAEQTVTKVGVNSTGFFSTTAMETNGATIIYIAIRRGTKVPESATEVFALQKDDTGDSNAPAFRSDFPVDFAIERRVNISDSNYIVPRLTAPNFLKTDNNQPENHGGANAEYVFDYSNGWNSTAAQNANTISYMWKRAPGFCDVVAYTGDGTAGRTVSHNLGVAPEMMWIKQRDSLRNWSVYHTGTDVTVPEDYNLRLDVDQVVNSGSTHLDSTAPTSSNFTLGSTVVVNGSSSDYIAYLFASLPGISKVGSYTGDGTTDGSKVIDCGFTSGARFVLIKRTNGGGSWYVWDTARGIVAGNDPRLKLESTDEEASFDNVDPHSSGFSVVGSGINNINGANYIFYAIA